MDKHKRAILRALKDASYVYAESLKRSGGKDAAVRRGDDAGGSERNG